MRTRWSFWLAAVAALGLAACADDGPVQPSVDLEPLASTAGSQGPGAVYVMSNASDGNEILAFDRAADGSLAAPVAYATGGDGTGAGLGNQASLILAHGHRRLYAVNAGSDDISAFDVGRTGLELIGGPVPSGGDMPISLTVHGDLLYVLNGGGGGNVTGFRIGTDGGLTPIAGSTQPLGGAGPAQIQFTPDGDVLVVTEKASNTLSTYTVGADGVAAGPNTQASAGQTPFGFNFNRRGNLVVSEAAGGAAGASTASSYRVYDNGSLELISGAVPTTQSAACWIAIGQNGLHAYTTNTGSGTVSSLAIGPRGGLELVDAVAGVTGMGSLPQDAAFTPGGRYLYVRNGGGTVGGFRVEKNGGLTSLGDLGTLPDGANGMAAR
ncbi:MAG: beta-propeller fold lactonase family protein [Gemmatimonadota bacterium]|jgi:6-phosphogluconolactonase (cycloisomerase 2 family)